MRVRPEETQWTSKERAGEIKKSNLMNLKVVMWRMKPGHVWSWPNVDPFIYRSLDTQEVIY